MHHLQHRVYRRAFRTPLRTAHGWWTEREGILVRAESDSGDVGFGEIAPIRDFGTETTAAAIEVLDSLHGEIDLELFGRIAPRFGCVRFAISCAMHGSPSGRLSSARFPVAGLLPAGKGALPALSDKLEKGYLAFKWKVGVEDDAAELGWLDELCSILPPYAKLRLDANGAWNRKRAGRWLDRCAERPIEFVEQPLPPEDRSGLLGLAGDFPVTLALDESVVRLDEARRWQAEGWRGVFVIKPALCGPLDELRRWIGETRADVVLSSAIETAVGRAAILGFVQCHGRELTNRALGFGVGEIFGDRVWDGTHVGPLLDSSWNAAANAEASWNALS
jgi:o-succinylbenzoate synthase